MGFLIGGLGFLSILGVMFITPMAMIRYASTLSLPLSQFKRTIG
jgi:hypothetical protein